MVTYQIRDWPEYFENAKSRTIKECTWVPMPNKQSGLGLSRILSEPDGVAIYGFWVLIVGACSRQRSPRDGWLTADGHHEGTPWTPQDLALMFRRVENEAERALAILSSKSVAWLEAHHAEVPQGYDEDTTGARSTPNPSTKEGRKEGREGRKAAPSPARTPEPTPAREDTDTDAEPARLAGTLSTLFPELGSDGADELADILETAHAGNGLDLEQEARDCWAYYQARETQLLDPRLALVRWVAKSKRDSNADPGASAHGRQGKSRRAEAQAIADHLIKTLDRDADDPLAGVVDEELGLAVWLELIADHPDGRACRGQVSPSGVRAGKPYVMDMLRAAGDGWEMRVRRAAKTVATGGEE